jgi:hypothetical protein
MKTRNTFFAAIFAAAVLIAATSFVLSAGAQTQSGGISTTPRRTAAIILQCRNYGGQQDVSKNPDIINTSNKTIASGKRLYWSATDGDSGSVVLTKAFAPGDKVGVNGKAGQSYSCKAWVNP